MVGSPTRRDPVKPEAGLRGGRGWMPGFSAVLLSVALSALLTAVLVISGVDWAYFVWVQNLRLFGPLMAADIFGYVFPVLVPVALLLAASRVPGRGYGLAGVGALVAAASGLAVSMSLKAVAGRVSPPHHDFGASLAGMADTSAAFNFGFMNTSILGGWPSSHATVAFAVVVAVIMALPTARALHMAGLVIAGFIGLGVSFGFHWVSEFLSGAMIGSAVGYWIGGIAAARKDGPATEV